MATSPNDYRDPKVTQDKSSGIGKWIAIAVAVILGLLLLGWLLGWFATDDDVTVITEPTTTETVPLENEPVVVPEPTTTQTVPLENEPTVLTDPTIDAEPTIGTETDDDTVIVPVQ